MSGYCMACRREFDNANDVFNHDCRPVARQTVIERALRQVSEWMHSHECSCGRVLHRHGSLYLCRVCDGPSVGPNKPRLA